MINVAHAYSILKVKHQQFKKLIVTVKQNKHCAQLHSSSRDTFVGKIERGGGGGVGPLVLVVPDTDGLVERAGCYDWFPETHVHPCHCPVVEGTGEIVKR